MYREADENKYGVDIIRVTFKLTYFGLALCLLSPGVFLLLGYFMEGPERQTFAEPARQQLFFWIFLGLSVALAGAAFFLKKTLFSKPLIRSESTFVSDFADAMQTRSLILYGLIDMIAVLGLTFFFMGGDLDGLMLFCLMCVIVFQLVRPRPGFIEDALAYQERLVSERKFAEPTGK